jgi:hypothetical protein
MNFDKLATFAMSVVITAALAGNLDRLTLWVHTATAKVLWESRASAWGSPYFFHNQNTNLKMNNLTKEAHHARNH